MHICMPASEHDHPTLTATQALTFLSGLPSSPISSPVRRLHSHPCEGKSGDETNVLMYYVIGCKFPCVCRNVYGNVSVPSEWKLSAENAFQQLGEWRVRVFPVESFSIITSDGNVSENTETFLETALRVSSCALLRVMPFIYYTYGIGAEHDNHASRRTMCLSLFLERGA